MKLMNVKENLIYFNTRSMPFYFYSLTSNQNGGASFEKHERE